MSGVEFKPCGGSDESQANILLPLGKSTVGRGTLLGIQDKRVSRNHGLMEVEDGKVKIMSTHTNPTFYQAKGASKLGPLEKDVWQNLQHGDKIGLTPDQHIFEVIIQDRPINISSQSLKTSMLESSPEKTPQKADNKDNNTVKAEGDKKVEGQQNGDDKNTDEDRSTEDEEQKEEKSEKKPVKDEKPKENQKTKDEKEENKDDEDTNGVGEESGDSADEDKEKVDTVKLDDGKEVALPVQKERTLPNWMDKPGEGKSPAAKGRGRPKKDSTSTKPAKQSPKSSQEGEVSPKKGRGRPKGSTNQPKVKSGRGRPRKRSGDDEDEEALSPVSKGVSRGKRKKLSGYKEIEDLEEEEEKEEEEKVIYKDDDDWMISEEEVESDISDWESSQRSHKGKGKAKKSPGRKGRGRPPKNARTPTRKASARGRKRSKSYFTDSEEDFFTDDDEIYVPKPTKRTAGKHGLSQSQQSVESGDDDVRRPVTKARPKAKKKATPVKKAAKKTKKKKPCDYGAECYRKNPSHFKEFNHPGDADYKSPKSSEGEQEPDEEGEEKEECPYGAECYRTNKSHLKQYKHAPPPASNRPKREAAQKKAVVIQGDRSSLLHSGVSDDDGAPNTYDDNDSFLDDAIMGSDQEADKKKGNASDDSDWSPGAGDEAKGPKKVKVH